MTEYPTGQFPAVKRSPQPGSDAERSLALDEHVRRIGQERGAHLCRRSPRVARRAGALAACGGLAAGVGVMVFLLRAMPIVVMVTSEHQIAWLGGGILALCIVVAIAGYGVARWRHSTAIPARGEIRAKGVGLLLAVVAALGVVAATGPWSFPSATVTGVAPVVLGLDLSQGDVVGGAIVASPHHEPVVYLKTRSGAWVSASIGPGAVGAVTHDLAGKVPYTAGEVARMVGNAQQGALHTDVERLWLVAGAMALLAVVAIVIERRRWRSAPWPAKVADDTVRAVARVYAQAGEQR